MSTLSSPCGSSATSDPVAVAVRVPYSPRPAPRPLIGAPSVLLDAGWQECVDRRRERRVEEPLRVLARWHDAPADPQGGLAAALRAGLALARSEGAAVVAPRGAGDPGELAAALGDAQPADVVVLRRCGRAQLRAELLAVALPSHWDPPARVGAALHELHAPVAGNARLQAAAPALSEALLTKGPFVQYVWGLQADDRLDYDTGAPPARPPEWSADPGRWFLRWERQVSTPLPGLDRALFWLRPYRRPLSGLSAAQRARLAAAVGSMDAATLRYKRLDTRREALLRWLHDAADPEPAAPI